jgi:hypothetical protein
LAGEAGVALFGALTAKGLVTDGEPISLTDNG